MDVTKALIFAAIGKVTQRLPSRFTPNVSQEAGWRPEALHASLPGEAHRLIRAKAIAAADQMTRPVITIEG